MASDLAVIVSGAVGVVGAGIGAFFGYLGIGRQAAVEAQRARGRQSEAFRKERQAAYLEFLETTYEFYFHRTGTATLTKDQYREWLHRLNRAVTAVSLLGTQDAYSRANNLAWAITKDLDYHVGHVSSAHQAALVENGGPRWDARAREEFIGMWDKAAEFMRKEVSVPRA